MCRPSLRLSESLYLGEHVMAPKRGAASAPPDDQDARFQAQSPRKSLKHDIALGEFLSHSRLESSERRARSSVGIPALNENPP